MNQGFIEHEAKSVLPHVMNVPCFSFYANTRELELIVCDNDEI